MRIALLTHSTNPRGGVSHALSLAEALIRQGHEAVVHAPDPLRGGFYRQAQCGTVSVPASPVAASETLAMVDQRISEYVAHFSNMRHMGFDVWHAHDGIGANALADLAARGRIAGFVRTVHHLDRFEEPRLAALQHRGVAAAAMVLCVSDMWREAVRREFGIDPQSVANGVDIQEFAPAACPADREIRLRYGLGDGPVMLSVGGCEPRKNTERIIRAFARFRSRHIGACLLIVGGASVLDHARYRQRCSDVLAELGLGDGPGDAVVRTGPVPQADMASLYRQADALVFPSLVEGFGLAVLEALACGTPVIASRIPPFTEYLDDRHALWVEPSDIAAIDDAMERALRPDLKASVTRHGPTLAARFDWDASARRHIALYQRMIGAAGQRSRTVAHA